MTITVTLDLSPEAEAELRESIVQHDRERVRQVLTHALTPTVEALLQQAVGTEPSDDEWEQLADQLIDTFTAALPADVSALSDDATSRAGIYADHP
jgi:hypothetical protein